MSGIRTCVRDPHVWWRAAEGAAELAVSDAGVFLNRLSDYLFVLARSLAETEVLWVPLPGSGGTSGPSPRAHLELAMCESALAHGAMNHELGNEAQGFGSSIAWADHSDVAFGALRHAM